MIRCRAGRFAAGLAFTLVAAVQLAAQDVTVAGRVIDAAGDAVAGQTVVLHRVTPEGGALLAQDTTDTQGMFALAAADATRDDGVFFVAARYEGELYIGPLLRPPLPEPGAYVLQVGVPGSALSNVGGTLPAAVPPGSATGSSRRWLLILPPLLGLLGLGVWALVRAAGPPARRRLLIRVADLDNEWETAPDPDRRPAYEDERRRLIEQIRSGG